MKKRIIALSMIAAMSAALPGTALAAETSQEQQISVTLTAEPEYTVTIPASVSMGNEGTYVDVTAEEITNLPEGKKISVTIAGTDKYNDQMVVFVDDFHLDVVFG